MLRVRVLTRQGCHLCVAAEETVAAVCAELNMEFELVDIDQQPELLAKYSDQVPVTFVDGKQHDFWRVSADRLRAALSA